MSTTPDPAGPAERPEDVESPATQPEPGAETPPEPVEATLPTDARVEATDVDVAQAVEGQMRRAPRYQNFLKVGALLGAVAGLFFGGLMLTLPGATSIDKPGVLFSLIVIAGVCVGMAVAGLLAIAADRRSLRRHRV